MEKVRIDKTTTKKRVEARKEGAFSFQDPVRRVPFQIFVPSLLSKSLEQAKRELTVSTGQAASKHKKHFNICRFSPPSSPPKKHSSLQFSSSGLLVSL